MIARAPGKLVLSGAYAVLEGAPALVAAVDRYALADASRPAHLITAEVRAALDAGDITSAPWFDASALRAAEAEGRPSRKLGLGSSAAILVASLAASAPIDARALDDAGLRDLFDRALAAHRAAQGGGSGIDVAASVFGGVLACRIPSPGRLDVRPHALPAGTFIDVFASPVSAETRSLLAAVRAFAARDPSGYRSVLGRASSAAERALSAASPAELASVVAEQARSLGELGRLAGAPIVTDDIEALAAAAQAEGAAFAPSGAGGGDVAFFLGGAPPSRALVDLARSRGLEHVELNVGAPGVHRASGA